MPLPVYLYSTRTDLLFVVPLPAARGVSADVFSERGVAVVCSQLGTVA